MPSLHVLEAGLGSCKLIPKIFFFLVSQARQQLLSGQTNAPKVTFQTSNRARIFELLLFEKWMLA